MHMYLFVRGKYEQVELWRAHAQAAYWKLRRINNKTGKEEILLVQGALRTTLLGAYEYVFPKEALAEVCSFFGIVDKLTNFMNVNAFGSCIWGEIPGKARYFTLRKIFGCRKIPMKIIEKAKEIPNSFSTEEFERCGANCIIPGVAVHCIGIKDDIIGDLGNYHYELL